MKNKFNALKRAVLILGLLGVCEWPSRMACAAATNVVLAGDDIQARINAAAGGDVMVIQSGAYSGTITISKALTLVRSGTAAVDLQGPVTINTPGAVSFAQLTFSDVVNITGGASVAALESRFMGVLGATDGKLTIRKCQLDGELRLTNAALTALRCTNSAWIVAVAAPNARMPLTIAQGNISGSVSTVGYAVNLAYSKLVSCGITDGEGNVVGNRFNRTEADGGVIMTSCMYGLRSKISISNNDIRAFLNVGGNGLYGITLDTCTSTVLNNTLFVDGLGSSYYIGGVNMHGASAIRIQGNIVSATGGRFTNDPLNRWPDFGGSLLISDNCFANTVGGDYNLSNSLTSTDPKLNPDHTLAFDSPCRNAGPADAIYNDRDGTRNDMGFTGGPLYNPANYTTDSPMAFWLNTTPRQVLKGAAGTIHVDAAATAGH